MSARREKIKRAYIRFYYQILVKNWESSKPKWWQFFKMRKWKNEKPTMKDAEKYYLHLYYKGIHSKMKK